jgi:hypothetical protein
MAGWRECLHGVETHYMCYLVTRKTEFAQCIYRGRTVSLDTNWPLQANTCQTYFRAYVLNHLIECCENGHFDHGLLHDGTVLVVQERFLHYCHSMFLRVAAAYLPGAN